RLRLLSVGRAESYQVAADGSANQPDRVHERGPARGSYAWVAPHEFPAHPGDAFMLVRGTHLVRNPGIPSSRDRLSWNFSGPLRRHSGQVEEEELGTNFARNGDGGFALERETVARMKRSAGNRDGAARDLKPAVAELEGVAYRAARIELCSEQFRVGINLERAVSRVGGGQQMQPVRLVLHCDALLLVLWRNAKLVRKEPDLEQVERLGVRGICFAVAHAGARRHVL